MKSDDQESCDVLSGKQSFPDDAQKRKNVSDISEEWVCERIKALYYSILKGIEGSYAVKGSLKLWLETAYMEGYSDAMSDISSDAQKLQKEVSDMSKGENEPEETVNMSGNHRFPDHDQKSKISNVLKNEVSRGGNG